MKDEVWGCINDLAMFLNLEQIMKLKKSLKKDKINILTDYWITEHEENDKDGNAKKIKVKEWQNKYDNAFQILKSHLENPISIKKQ